MVSNMTEAQKRAKQNYQKKMNRFTIDFCPTEQALWEQIQKQPKKQTYIKMLIQRDIDRENTNVKNNI